MQFVQIGEITFEILPLHGDEPESQRDLHGVLCEAAEREIRLTPAELVHQFGFKSALPLEARLKHLQQRGRLKPILRWKDCPICQINHKVHADCGCCEGTGKIAVAISSKPSAETSPHSLTLG